MRLERAEAKSIQTDSKELVEHQPENADAGWRRPETDGLGRRD